MSTKTQTNGKQKAHPDSYLNTRKVKIKVVGIGGGGSSIVSEMVDSLKGVSFLVADTDGKVLSKARKGVRTFQFGEKIAHGMGTGMNTELARKAATEAKEKISRIFQDQDLVFLVGSLGGGVASGAGPIFASQLLEQKGLSIGIFTMPFSFEGEKKMKIAKKALIELRENLSGVIVVPNEKIFGLVDKKTSLKKSLSALNQVFAGWLQDLIGLISKHGLINVDFADLKTILSARGKNLFFGQGIAHGPNRAEEAVKNIFQNPFFEGEPKNVRRILFNIAGGKDLGLKEVETISRQIAKLNPKAKIIFGISEDVSTQSRIKVTLLCVSDIEKSERNDRKIFAKKSEKKKFISGKLISKKSKKVKAKSDKEVDDESQQEKIQQKTRRSALEVKKDEKDERDREWAREPEWEIPAFLRNKE